MGAAIGVMVMGNSPADIRASTFLHTAHYDLCPTIYQSDSIDKRVFYATRIAQICRLT